MSNNDKPAATPAVPLDATSDYQSGAAGSGSPSPRPEVVLLTGSPVHSSTELQTLLRQRLRVLTTVTAIGLSLYALQQRLALGTGPDTGFLDLIERRPWVVPILAFLTINAIAAVTLWTKCSLSLPVLRAFELVVFGGGTAFNAFDNWSALNRRGYLPEVFQFGNSLVNSMSISWLVLITAYGTLVPNRGRRCAVVVIGMALIAVSVNVSSLAAQAIPRTDMVRFLLIMWSWLLMAVTIAIFGSRRLERLRREAFAARCLGQYQLKEQLGVGGMGEVYLAEHVLLRRPCAVKLIRPERAGDPQQLRRFEREVRTMATLTHANTVQIFDYGHTADGTFYYAMEYLPGLTLEQMVKQFGPLPPPRVIHFLSQLAWALREAHGVGLIHRDIKPSNVMICERGGVSDVVKLLDFGLVLGQKDDPGNSKLTQEGALAGTPAYMSPEQAGGAEDVDARSDIYSGGCVAYFLLTGRPPFTGSSAVRIMAAHLYETPSPLGDHCSDIPEELQAIVARRLAKEPADRFACIHDLERALARCQSADQWTEDAAALWWQSHSAAGEGVRDKQAKSH